LGILSYGQANENRVIVVHFPSVSYVIRNFGKPIAQLAKCFHDGFLLDLFLNPEDGFDIFRQNVG
jgi:hypothetical protein